MAETLSDSGNSLIRQGGNSPPPDAFKESAEFRRLASAIGDYFGEAKNWADGVPIDNDAVHDKVTELYDKLGALAKEADEMRVGLNRPYDEGKAAVQKAFNAFIADTKTEKGVLVTARASLMQLLTPYRVERQRKADEAARKLRERADAEAAAAQEAIRKSSGDLETRVAAEGQLKEAKGLDKMAKKATTAANTGTGLRRAWVANVTDLNKALGYYYQGGKSIHRAEFEALVLRLAGDDVRHGTRDNADGTPAIPGIKITQEAKAS